MNIKSLFTNNLLYWIIVVFCLQLASQAGVRPFNEAMDGAFHLAYIVFYSAEGHPPRPNENSIPSQISKAINTSIAPDFPEGSKYRAWAHLSNDHRKTFISENMAPVTSKEYNNINYQCQHPPLYYFILSLVYPIVCNLSLDKQFYMLSLMSIIIASLSMIAIYKLFKCYWSENISCLILLCLAWYPELMVFIGRVTNDTLAITLISWSIYLAFKPNKTTKSVMISGILLVLACFTKAYAYTLWPVYLMTALIDSDYESRLFLNWRRLIIAGAISLVGVVSLLLYNFINTGHVMLLTQLRDTVHVSKLDIAKEIAHIDPVWFVGAMVKGFWWSGDWSFVSPGWMYYMPIVAIVGFLLIKQPNHKNGSAHFFEIKMLWPHYIACLTFIAAMLWNSAVWKVRGKLIGDIHPVGAEGWYMVVIIICVFSIIFYLASQRISTLAFTRILAGLSIFFICWNLIARIALYLYWSGHVSVSGRLRGIHWLDAIKLSNKEDALSAWLSLPGVMHPVAFTYVIPLFVALVISFAIIKKCLTIKVASES